MKRTERFTNLAEVQQEKLRLNEVRKQHQARLERHWHALQDHDVRGHLLRDAANDALRSWKPLRMVSSLLGDGSVKSAFSAALHTRGGLGKRAIWFAATMALPGLIRKVSGISLDKLGDELRVSYDRIRDRLLNRQEERSPEASDRHV